MNDWLRYLISVLAVLRIAYLLAHEDGPFDIIADWRAKVGQVTWIGRGFHCVLCISFWLSLLAGLIAFGWDGFVAWFGIAGGVMVIWLILERVIVSER